ncbi:MAG: hypothetical protein JWM33_3584 [Caulobacteraceae bacterium]|nr:hypothetical protein [Caulobacteraceae bacterium]
MNSPAPSRRCRSGKKGRRVYEIGLGQHVSMKLTDDIVEGFRTCWEDAFGEVIPVAEARIRATQLVEFFFAAKPKAAKFDMLE